MPIKVDCRSEVWVKNTLRPRTMLKATKMRRFLAAQDTPPRFEASRSPGMQSGDHGSVYRYTLTR